MTSSIVMSGVVKRFGRRTALDGLDLEVATGEVHGFLGPNGAGKSTSIRVLLGQIRADAGRTELLGGDPWRDAVALHRRLAYVPGEVALWPSLTGGEAIDLLGRLRGGVNPVRRRELTELFELDPTVRMRAYSKGNRQKVALVAALAADTELLLLDEPTSGLDPLMEAVFTECIRQVAAQGRTVLLSSHILAEVEALCDRVTIVRGGRQVRSGTLDELRGRTRTSVRLQVADDDAATALVGELDVTDGVHDIDRDGARVRFQVDGDRLPDLLESLGRHQVHALTAHPPTLEDLFLREYGGVR
jgi:ABC-2 type transport system ATP-binding protein